MKRDPAFRKAMGSRIREARKAKGYTIERLAEKVDMAPQYLSEVERGIKTLGSEHLRAVSMVLHRSTDFFIHGVGGMEAKRANVLEELIAMSPIEQRQAVQVLEQVLRVVKSAEEAVGREE